MRIRWRGFELPSTVTCERESLTSTYGKFVAEPFERGFGVTVGNALDAQYGDIYTRNAGNGAALMGLRDVKMFDESTLSDGYAGLMAQVGTRAQSALYAAELSSSIAHNLESDRTAVAGVNLDEEAAKLIQYQQAYQASAKMLQIAQNIFDNLIQTMGR